MLDFTRSTFTWTSHPWTPDPHYRWDGGFVGTHGQVYHVRFTLQSRCVVQPPSGEAVELFLGSPCRSEYTIADRNMFQVPGGEWRMAFSHTHKVPIAASLDDVSAPLPAPLSEVFASHTIDLRSYKGFDVLTHSGDIAGATLGGRILSGSSTWTDEASGCEITLEFPVNVMNLNVADSEFQICTGPVLVPDLRAWHEHGVARAYVAHVALSAFDHVELMFRRPVEVTDEVKTWLHTPVGRDRHELLDPANPPPGGPPSRPQPTVYHDVREYAARNVILTTD